MYVRVDNLVRFFLEIDIQEFAHEVNIGWWEMITIFYKSVNKFWFAVTGGSEIICKKLFKYEVINLFRR